ncbi:unnamed protein product [Spirodela intermedia]|uniref:Uncharacterized protein n=1 Tax=Spirodela intermedia TaxID=51605 RepID=A0ABN7EA98_SPIIN|nr:unnamed protein product [Spirodela intermedia]
MAERYEERRCTINRHMYLRQRERERRKPSLRGEL